MKETEIIWLDEKWKARMAKKMSPYDDNERDRHIEKMKIALQVAQNYLDCSKKHTLKKRDQQNLEIIESSLERLESYIEKIARL